MKTIIFANQKGGCGKTTTAHSVAHGLSRRGCRVLLVDADAQCNLSDLEGLEDTEGLPTLRSMMKRERWAEDCITELSGGLAIIPGDILLSGIDLELSGDVDAPYMLREGLQRVADRFDYCIIDTPPTLGIMTTGALVAADQLVIPLTPDRFSMKGLNQLYENVQKVKRRINSKLQIAGLLLTRCDRTNASEAMTEAVEEYAQENGLKVFRARIRQGVAVRESQILHGDIFENGSGVADDYNEFIDELTEG